MQESVSKNLGHQNFYMMNHRWKENQCIHCGIKRKRHYSKLLMAITDFPPYDHYLREMIWVFSFDGGKWTSTRPDCVRKNDDRVHTHTEQNEV